MTIRLILTLVSLSIGLLILLRNPNVHA